MTLTPEQQRDILARLDEVWPKPRVCPICQNHTWLMQPRLFVHLLQDGVSAQPMGGLGALSVQQEALPALLFHCGTCGYVATFLAANFGVGPSSAS